jgi:LPS-assembly protein
VPITVRTTLFDEYLNVSYQSYLYAQHTKFQNDVLINPKEYQDGYYLRDYHQFNASTQLTKPYQSFIHTMEFSTSYIRSGYDKRNGFYEDCKDDDTCDKTFYHISDIKEAITLNFNQYIFKDGKQILYHRLSDIIADPGKENEIGELESELDLYITQNIKYYNNLFYNFTFDKISKQLNKITYSNYSFNLSLSHFYKKDLKNDKTSSSYITSSFRYRYNSHYSYVASLDYDLEYKVKKRAEVGFLYQKRCWDFGLRYTENNRPILTNNDASSIYDRYLYFTVVLKPIMKKTASDFFGLRLPKVLKGS